LKTSSSQRGLRWGALLLLATLPTLPAHARVHHTEAWARDHFAAAERMREALNGRPPADRTRHDYQRVINNYRNVYFGAPTSTKADPSVVAVAETLVEMGRRFEDDKILNEAIAQYKFLRREYPGSKYRCDALFTIGEIYKDDLDDPEQARAAFEEFLRRYPHNRLVEDAQQAIADLDQQAEARKSGKEKAEKEQSGKKEKEKVARSSGGSDNASDKPAAEAASADQPARKFPRVTGIRHWSAPDYSRVAIDLEGDIKFSSQRIAHPDRIFFDLPGTKLASTLVGKSFDVDDGFLNKIRVAQFKPGHTRVVLEVDDLSDYDAFLLPNPYRLIIDIHGKDGQAKNAHSKPPKEETTTADVEAPSKVVPKADAEQIKAALQAEGERAPVTSMDVNDATKVAPKDMTAGSKPTSNAKKAPTPPVKKVVDADDDDDTSPAEAAMRDAPEGNSHATSVVASSRGKPGVRMAKGRKPASDFDVREAQPTASGDRSLIRALGLKIGRIVIDPGHGGHDTGTVGPNGLEEKDLVLEVGKRLGKLLETRLGAEVVYTRKDDTFIPLETRTAIANRERADLFVSIHANSSRDPAARGVETYYLNFTSSPEALEVAARENAVSEKSIYELQDLVKKIALKEKIEESREFAGDVQDSLHRGLAAKSPAIRDRGVKKAPFIVLIGANMPSILAEISFVSNPTDERRLETAEYRQRIAESLYRGIAKYVNGLSGVKVASKIDKAAGQ
jgi:N-acetylmuramoyl-L-alanine amidase